MSAWKGTLGPRRPGRPGRVPPGVWAPLLQGEAGRRGGRGAPCPGGGRWSVGTPCPGSGGRRRPAPGRVLGRRPGELSLRPGAWCGRVTTASSSSTPRRSCPCGRSPRTWSTAGTSAGSSTTPPTSASSRPRQVGGRGPVSGAGKRWSRRRAHSLFQNAATASSRWPCRGPCSGVPATRASLSLGRPPTPPSGVVMASSQLLLPGSRAPHSRHRTSSAPHGWLTALHGAVRCLFEGILAFGVTRAGRGWGTGREAAVWDEALANLVPQTQRRAFSIFRKDPYG